MTVLFQTGPGVFDRTPLSLGDSSTIRSPRSVQAADLDGDGDLDLVNANVTSDTLTVFFQAGPGVFDPIPLSLGDSSTTDNPLSVQAADLDGDGDLDLVSANTTSDTLTVFFQTGRGVFDSTPLTLGDSGTTNGAFSVQAADLDGDGDLDLVSANASSDTLTIFFQTGPGVFDPTPLTLGDSGTTNGAFSVQAADLDGDGDLDLVSANASSDTLTVFFQTGRGVFDPTPLSLGDSSTTSGPVSVQAADLDGDGDLDLVSANPGSDTLTVFFQTGRGVFDSTPLSLGDSSTTNNPRSVQAADLDGDGDLDLVSANGFSDTLTVFFQTGPGLFDPSPLSLGDSSTTNFPVSVQAVDLDGDGDLDLVSANRDSDSLTVFFGNSDRL